MSGQLGIWSAFGSGWPAVRCKGKKVKMHTYIALPEVHGHHICRRLYITSTAGLLHPNLVWRFQEATYIPMQGGAMTCMPSNAMALPVLNYTWVGWSLVNLKQGSAQPKIPQFWLWSVLHLQSLTHEPRTIPLHHRGSTSTDSTDIWWPRPIWT